MNSNTARGADIAIVGAAGKTGRAVVSALHARLARASEVASASALVSAMETALRDPAAGARPAHPHVAIRAQEPTRVRRLSRTSEHPIDLETGAGLHAALSGCRAAYFIAPNVHPDEPALLRRFVEAAADAGVDHVVYHSVAWPHTPLMPHHWDKARGEDLLRALAAERGLRWTVLQPCAYAENFADVLAGAAGHLTVPYSPDTLFRFVSLGDVAEIAARVLTEGPYAHHGATYELGGPSALSVRQLVRLVEAVTGAHIPIVRIAPEQWAAAQSPDLPDDAVRRLLAMFEYYDRRDFLAGSAMTAALLGRPPTSVRELIAT